MTDIVRITRYMQGDVSLVDIEGLGIFQANGIAMKGLAEPRMLFLHALSQAYDTSLHLGAVALEGQQVEEALGQDAVSAGYLLIQEGPIRNGAYVNGSEPQGVYFARTPQGLFSIAQDNEWGVDYFVVSDQLSLYGPEAGSGSAGFVREVAERFNAIEHLNRHGDYASCDAASWLSIVLDYFVFAVSFDADGLILTLASRRRPGMDIANDALSQAIARINSSVWFSEIENSLRWNYDLHSLCVS